MQDDTLNIEKFDPTAAQLFELVAIPVDITDPLNADQVKAAHDKRMKLREARVNITKTGKAMREGALKFQKAVIAKENELVAIVEPEETRLQGFEDEAAILKDREDRKAILPRRRQQLAELEVDITDEAILDMDGTAFQTFINSKLHEKNVRDAAVIKAREDAAKKVEEDNARERERIEAEKNAQAREAAAREEERKAAEQREKDRIEREKRDAAKKVEEEAVEKKRLQEAEKYRAWRAELGWTEATKDSFMEDVVTSGGKKTVVLYKKLGVFVPEV